VLGHAAEESDGSANVHAVVFEGDLGGFTDGLYSVSGRRRDGRISRP
jgi:hypothetical protein